MQTKLFSILSLMLITLLTITMPVSSNAENKLSKRLDDFLSIFEEHGFSGTVLIAKDDKVILKQGYGLADHKMKIPVTTETAFSIASLTKQFISAAVLSLEEQGLLSTNDPIIKHLGYIPDDKSEITIHQLLNHTSGLESDYWDQNQELTIDEYRKMVISKPLLSKPGEQFEYCNFGYNLLTDIIEKTSHKNVEQYLHERFFEPLGMLHTGFSIPIWEKVPVAHYQDWTSNAFNVNVELPNVRPPYLAGNISTIEDLHKWHIALTQNKVLNDSSKHKMFKPYKGDYGYGWNIINFNDDVLRYHGGTDTHIGVTAGYYHYLKDDIVVLILSNTNLSGSLTHEYLMSYIENILFNRNVTFPPISSNSSSDNIISHSGTYIFPSGDSLKIVERNGKTKIITVDKNSSLLINFPNIIVYSDEDKYLNIFDTIFQGIRDNNLEPLKNNLWTNINFDSFSKKMIGGYQYFNQVYGDYLGAKIVHQKSFNFQERNELWSFVCLDFKNGKVMLRAMHNQDEKVLFSLLDIPEHFEMTLGSSAKNVYTSWNCFTGVSSTFNFVTDDDGKSQFIEILSDKGSIRGELID